MSLRQRTLDAETRIVYISNAIHPDVCFIHD